MAAEWRATTLGEFVRLQRGHDLTAEQRKPGDYPVMGSAGQNGTHGEFIAAGPGVVIGRSGASMGRVHFTPRDYWPHNTCLYVTDFLGNDPCFAFYLLGTLDLASYNSGSVQPSLNRNYIYTKLIQVPPPKEQTEIAGFLGALDDRIDNLRQTNAALEAIAAALFKAWFVDFEPVRARQQGRWQRGQSLPGLPAHLYDLFPERLVDSELGKIPEKWECVPTSQLIEFNPVEPLRKGVPAPYLDMASLPTSDCWAAPPTHREFGSGMRFRNNDTLLARITPCLENGKTAFIQSLPNEAVGWGSTEFIVIRPKTPVPPEFGYLLARHDAFRDHAIRSMTGTSGRQRAQVDSVAAFKLAAPKSEGIWESFSHIAKPIFRSIKANSEASSTLAALRDALLPKLISGELRLPAASCERAAPAASVTTVQGS